MVVALAGSDNHIPAHTPTDRDWAELAIAMARTTPVPVNEQRIRALYHGYVGRTVMVETSSAMHEGVVIKESNNNLLLPSVKMVAVRCRRGSP